MPICEYGAVLRPDAPEYFEFEEAWVANIMATIPFFPIAFIGAIYPTLLGLPTGSVNSADFVDNEPEGELPRFTDWSLYNYPPAALLTGAYQRLGNLARVRKYNELALCNQPPGGGPSLWTTVCQFELSGTAQPNAVIQAICGPFEPNVQVGFRKVLGSDASLDDVECAVVCHSYNVGDPVPPYVAGNYAGVGTPPPNSQWSGSETVNGIHNGQQHWVIGYLNAYPPDPETFLVIEAGYYAPTMEPEEPPETVVDPPPGCPDLTDPAGFSEWMCALGHKIDRIEAMVEWIAANMLPPTADTDEDETPVDPEEEIEKPHDAIGAVLSLTAPASYARFGDKPGVIFRAGHVSQGTKDGWMPSVQLKHAQQVVWPLAPSCTKLGLDLQPGVSAGIRWLRAPK